MLTCAGPKASRRCGLMSDRRGCIANVGGTREAIGARPPAPRYRLVRRSAPTVEPVALDSAQQAVAAHASGPLLVLGGPGTGKTTALVEAVAARVGEGSPPDHILILTFGRRAANALRDRIEARLGRGTRDHATMSEPVVRTFPAYAFGLLRLAAAERGEPAPRLLTGPEQDAVIRDMLAAPDAADRWPAGPSPSCPYPCLRGRVARPAAACGRTGHRSAHARRPRPLARPRRLGRGGRLPGRVCRGPVAARRGYPGQRRLRPGRAGAVGRGSAG